MSPDTSSRHTGEADKNEEVYVENSDDERHTPNKATAPVGEDRINVSDADVRARRLLPSPFWRRRVSCSPSLTLGPSSRTREFCGGQMFTF